MKIEAIKAKVRNSEYFMSQHAIRESAKDGLADEDIEKAVLNGMIIEEYPSDPRGKSCLICGSIKEDKFVHVVIGSKENEIIIITVYIPEPPKWESPYKRGGKGK